MPKIFTKTKVVSRNFIMDFIAYFQNITGQNLTGYEKMINKGIQQIKGELKEEKIRLKWFRFEITQLTNGAVAVVLYGEKA